MSDENQMDTVEKIEIDDAAPLVVSTTSLDDAWTDYDITSQGMAAGVEDEVIKPWSPDIEDEIKHAPGKPLGRFEKLRRGELEKMDGSERRSG